MNPKEFELTQAIERAFKEPAHPAPVYTLSISYADLKALTDLARWVRDFDSISAYDNEGVKSPTEGL